MPVNELPQKEKNRETKQIECRSFFDAKNFIIATPVYDHFLEGNMTKPKATNHIDTRLNHCVIYAQQHSDANIYLYAKLHPCRWTDQQFLRIPFAGIESLKRFREIYPFKA